jgi:hypothetical protein
MFGASASVNGIENWKCGAKQCHDYDRCMSLFEAVDCARLPETESGAEQEAVVYAISSIAEKYRQHGSQEA